jgi:hypothetical protein
MHGFEITRSSVLMQLPVLVVATKADLSAIPSDGDEAAAVEAILAETDSLLTKFPVQRTYSPIL